LSPAVTKGTTSDCNRCSTSRGLAFAGAKLDRVVAGGDERHHF
jgi:hypothetical protein